MAGIAGDQGERLWRLSRLGAAAVLVAGLLVTAVGNGVVGTSRSRAVALHASGHPQPPPVEPANATGSIPASTPGPAPTEASLSGLASAAAPIDPGSGDSAVAATTPAGAPVVSEPGHGQTAEPTSSTGADPRPAPAPGPAASPAPAPLPQPPGLGARPLPGLPPVIVPGASNPLGPPPSSGTTRYPSGSTGYDISWPQCGQSYPPKPYTVAIVGVNDGQAFSQNPCFGSESSWAGSGINLYININSPTSVDRTDQSGPAGQCVPGDNACLAYNYGYNGAANSVAMAANQGVRSPTWWIDVETVGSCTNLFPTAGTGYWSCNTSLNARTIQGAIDALRHAGLTPGDYSTHYQWGVITGGYVPSGGSVPNWIAGASSSSWCSGSHDFGGGQPWLLQFAVSGQYDQDQAC